jgi:hypothetical protein
VKRFLQAMEPRGAAKIVREFKTADEQQRIHRILDQMRATSAAIAPAVAPGSSEQPSVNTEEP